MAEVAVQWPRVNAHKQGRAWSNDWLGAALRAYTACRQDLSDRCCEALVAAVNSSHNVMQQVYLVIEQNDTGRHAVRK